MRLSLSIVAAVLAVAAACSDAALGVPLSPDAGQIDGGDAGACAATEQRCAEGCADLTRDDRNCGSCGTACGADHFCRAGRCRACTDGDRTSCGGTCVDLRSDPLHCGACGQACPVSSACMEGECVRRCADGESVCGAACVDVRIDPANCGGCGHACAAGRTCAGGACRCSDAALVACGDACVDPTKDKTHCGATAGCGSFAGYAGSRCTANGYCGAGACRTCRTWSPGWSISFTDLAYQPPFIATADFNRDTKLDIVVLKRATGEVVLFLGNGDGTFTRGTSFASGPRPLAIAAGDIDGDGKRDLVIGRAQPSPGQSDFVTVWAGNGDGTFTKGPIVPDVLGAERVVLGDLDEDGRTDIFAMGYSGAIGDDAHVALARPAGAFAVSANYAPDLKTRFGVASGEPSFADADGDGDLDLVILTSYSVGVFFGRGDGTLGASWVMPGISGPRDMTVGDADGDGRLDFFPRTYDAERYAILGGFGGASRTWSPPTLMSWNAGSARLEDVTGDGVADLVGVTVDRPTQMLVVRAGVGDGTFLPPESFPFAATYAGDLVVADLDGDARRDIVATTLTGIQVVLGKSSSEPECQ